MKPTRKQLAEAIDSVECSAMANNFGECTLNAYRDTAMYAAVDWLNERKLDNSYADEIVAAVLRRAGFS